jgi:hypothetical protein
VKASGRGKAVLARRSRMKARALISFTPVGGATQTAKHTLTLRP